MQCVARISDALLTHFELECKVQVRVGDANALKKRYHRLAAKLHPDRQLEASIETRALAEELFKLVTIAFREEVDKISRGPLGGTS